MQTWRGAALIQADTHLRLTEVSLPEGTYRREGFST